MKCGFGCCIICHPISAWTKTNGGWGDKKRMKGGKQITCLRIKSNLQTNTHEKIMYSRWNGFVGFEVENERKMKETWKVTKSGERLLCHKGANPGTLEGTLAFWSFKDAHVKYHSVNLFTGNLYKWKNEFLLKYACYSRETVCSYDKIEWTSCPGTQGTNNFKLE